MSDDDLKLMRRIDERTWSSRRPNTSRAHPAHPVYPYLLRGLSIERSNQVWTLDITYVPMARGFVYLIRQDHRQGFSILRTNREREARTCEIYLPNARRPKDVDDEATLNSRPRAAALHAWRLSPMSDVVVHDAAATKAGTRGTRPRDRVGSSRRSTFR